MVGWRRQSVGTCALVVVLWAASPIPASAACQLAPHDGDCRTFTVVFENDLFARTDRGYTSGERLSYVTPVIRSHDEILWGARQLPALLGWKKVRAEYALNQSIFTPADITQPIPDPRDRPYAGWLEASFGLIGEKKQMLLGQKWSVFDQMSASIGLVGRGSLAEQTQKFIHSMRALQRPMGWDSQLRDEPTLQLRHQRSWRSDLLRVKRGSDVVGFDLTPHAGYALGNAMTYAQAGMTLRFGNDLQDDYGPPRVAPSIPGSGFFSPTDRFGWYVFGSIEGRAVARNLFLDGNTFQDSPRVDKLPLVGDLQAGVVLIFQHVRLSYTHIWRSKEFEGQGAADAFGVVSASVRW
jgi:lipid A 3-O-deacylase